MVKKLTGPIHDMCISHGGNKMGSDPDADFWDRGTYRMIKKYSLCTANIVLRHFRTSFPLRRQRMYRCRILGRNPDKRLKSFPPCYSQSHHTALPWDLYFFKLTQPRTVTVHCKRKRRKPDRKPYVPPSLWFRNYIHTETSSLRTPKIMPRNVNEIVRSWIRLL